MGAELSYPVILLEIDDGSAYECGSYEALLGRVEPIDVENGEYAAWDACQRELKLTVAKGNREWLRIDVTDGYADSKEFELFRSRAKQARVSPGLLAKMRHVFQKQG